MEIMENCICSLILAKRALTYGKNNSDNGKNKIKKMKKTKLILELMKHILKKNMNMNKYIPKYVEKLKQN